MIKKRVLIFLISMQSIIATAQIAELKPEILNYEPFIWQSETPEDCPFISLYFIKKITSVRLRFA